jgi:hypothetical protein
MRWQMQDFCHLISLPVHLKFLSLCVLAGKKTALLVLTVVITQAGEHETSFLGVGWEVIPNTSHDRHVSVMEGTAVAHS